MLSLTLFGAATLLLAWLACVYFLVIRSAGCGRGELRPDPPAEWPRVAVIVPCYDEEEHVLAKVENLRAQDYPRDRLRVIFVESGSTDRTRELLETELKDDDGFELVESPRRGKAAQLNHVLPLLEEEIVVNTDADARMEPDCLSLLVAELVASPDVQVVGAYTYPEPALELDQCYWVAQNKSRLLESDASSASLVTGPCYAFRRELIESYPEDTFADDMFIALEAAARGGRTIYSRHAVVREVRGPESLLGFLQHKLSKGRACLRESLRFFGRMAQMDVVFRMIFITRLAQQVLLPWAALGWLAAAAAVIVQGRPEVVLAALALLFVLLVRTKAAISDVEAPAGPQRFSTRTVLCAFVLTNVALVLSGLSYPFERRASHPRVEAPATAGARDGG